MILMFALSMFVDTLDLSEVGGLRLASAVTAHQKTYLFYGTGPMNFDLFIYNWENDSCVLVPKDGRVKPMAIAYIVPHQKGVAIVDIAKRKVYVLTPEGSFMETIDLRNYMEDGEIPAFASPGPGNRFYLSTKLDKHDFYGWFDIETKTRETIYQVPRKGSHYIVHHDGKHVVIKDSDGEIEVLNEIFEVLSSRPPLFEQASISSVLKGEGHQSIRDPFVAGGFLTLSYQAKRGKKRIEASARFDGEQLVFSAHRPLALSPDGERLMIYSCEDDVLRIVPKGLTFSETRFPPVPGDQWPPVN